MAQGKYLGYRGAMSSVRAGRLARVYVLWGDGYLVSRLTAAIRDYALPEGRDFDEVRLDAATASPAEARAAIRTVPFLGDKRLIILERARFLKAKSGKAAVEEEAESDGGVEQVPSGSTGWDDVLTDVPPTTCVIIQAEGAPDSRLKLTRLAAGYGGMVECQAAGRDAGALATDVLREAASDLDLKLDYRSIGLLLTTVGTDCGQLVQELDKLSLFCGNRKVTDADILLLCPRTAEADIWQLLDAVEARDAAEASRIVRAAFGRGESPVALVASLASQVRMMARARERVASGVQPSALPGVLGANKFWVDQSLRRARRFSLAALYRCLRELARLDLAIKTGQREPETALESLVLALCAARQTSRSTADSS